MKRSGFLFDQGTPDDWRHFRPFGPTLGMFEKGTGEKEKEAKPNTGICGMLQT